MEEKVTFKETIHIWDMAIHDIDKGDIDAGLEKFNEIIETSAKISYNVGIICIQKKVYSESVSNFLACVDRDPHLALGHYALGWTYAALKQYNKSRQHYETARKLLRGHDKIDYNQLGIQFVLWECDILHNLAATFATLMSEFEWPLDVLDEGLSLAATEEQRDRITSAIRSLKAKKPHQPISLPNAFFKPDKNKVKNLKNVDFLGHQKVISTASVRNTNKLKVPPLSSSAQRSPSPRHGPSPIFQPPPPPTNNTFQPIRSSNASDQMTHKDNLIIWHEGVLSFEKGDVGKALESWLKINDPSAKILYNIASAQLITNDVESAKKTCQGVINKDEHLAIGRFLQGIIYCKLASYTEAWESFNKAFSLLRGKDRIDYGQLGLSHKIYKCEILVNQAYCYLHSGMKEWTTPLLTEAQSLKIEPKHSVIDVAVEKDAKNQPFDYIELPLQAVFKPPKSKIDNLDKQDFLGKAKVVTVLKTNEINVNEIDQRSRKTTPPIDLNPLPIPEQAHLSSTNNHQKNEEQGPPIPLRTLSIDEKFSPGPPERPVLPQNRLTKQSNIPKKGPPKKNLPPPPTGSGIASGGRSFNANKSLPPSPPSSTTPALSPSASPVLKRKGPPRKTVPPAPTSSNSSSKSSSSSSRSNSPNLEHKRSDGPPKRGIPPSPVSHSPKSVTPPQMESPSFKRTAIRRGVHSSSKPVTAVLVVPANATPFSNSTTQQERNQPHSVKHRIGSSVIVTAGFTANNDNEISITEGDILKLLSQGPEWSEGELKGKKGRFPTSHITDLSRPNIFE